MKSKERFFSHPEWALDRTKIESHQLDKFNHLLQQIVPANPFYREKQGEKPPQITSLEQLASLPLTTKEELVEAVETGKQLTFPPEHYIRFHQTSGTRGKPIAICDTAEDWRWWLQAWTHVLDAAGIGQGSRAMLAFSFGPFIGFWSAFDALVARGVQTIPGGGMSSIARLELIARAGADVLFCTPSYALHLAEVASAHSVDASQMPIETIVVAGEPGGSLPATRKRIEQAWRARVVDHSGATEVGPWGFGDDLWNETPGLRIIETEFLAEFLKLDSDLPAQAGELARLILTPLGRVGSPVIRYVTGDLVRAEWPSKGPCSFVRLAGGVVGREDDMLIVRGVNVFPSSIEQILRGFPEVAEHRIVVRKRGEMDELVIEVEDHLDDPQRIAKELQLKLSLSVDVRPVTLGSLPRSAGGKTHRVVSSES